MIKSKIGIMGGTFNPVHNGHLMLATAALKQFGLDKVIFIPTGVSYFKNQREILSPSVRYEMVSLAVRDNCFFDISDIDIKRKGNTYTFETLSELNRIFPDSGFYLIVGEDSFYSMESWKKPSEIFSGCTVLVAGRNVKPEEQFENYRFYLKQKYDAEIELLENPFMDISSSGIRKRIRDGVDCSGLLPEEVFRYILSNNLYRQ